MENRVVLERVNEFESQVDRTGCKSTTGKVMVKYGNYVNAITFHYSDWDKKITHNFENKWNEPFEKTGVVFDLSNLEKDYKEFFNETNKFNKKLTDERKTAEYKSSFAHMLKTITKNRGVDLSFISLEDFLNKSSWDREIVVTMQHRGKEALIEMKDGWYIGRIGYKDRVKCRDISKIIDKTKNLIGDIISQEENNKIQAIQKKNAVEENIKLINKELKRDDVFSEEVDEYSGGRNGHYYKRVKYYIEINKRKFGIQRGESYETKKTEYSINGLTCLSIQQTIDIIKILEKK